MAHVVSSDGVVFSSYSSSSPFFCLFSSFGGMMLSRSLYKALTVEVMACQGVDMVEYIGS
jgi:hypothetical protein